MNNFLACLKSSRTINFFIRNAAKTAFWLGVIAALLQVINRSALKGELLVDEMTLSGILLFFSSGVLLYADRFPVLKRLSGALGLGYIGLLLLDAYGKTGFSGVILGSIMTIITCLAMMFEHKDGHKSPLFYSAMLSALTKIGILWYGVANDEWYFIVATLFGVFENIAVGLTDNKIRTFFEVDEFYAKRK